jgi:radical SAM superfamily enzyme YgiQ (UPF0313 family)
LKQAGLGVNLKDYVHRLRTDESFAGRQIYHDIAAEILDEEPDLVAFGCQCVTGPGVLQVAGQIKLQRPDTYVLLGGHDVSHIPQRYMEAFPQIDGILCGECELSMKPLAEALNGQRSFGQVDGLVWRGSDGIRTNAPAQRIADLDDLLPLDYSIAPPLESYFSHSLMPTILVDSGRGCAFACDFCQATLLTGRKVRYRSVPSLLTELAAWERVNSNIEIYFVHDLFTARRSFVEDFCRQKLAAGVHLTWTCRARVDEVDDKLLTLMAAAGCVRLLYGIESGSDQALKAVHKQQRRSHNSVMANVRNTVHVGIMPSLSMITGTPEESRSDLESTMHLASDFMLLGPVRSFIQLMSPLPGTSLTKRLEGRLIYENGQYPTAFSQGIEFDSGRVLATDEAYIRDYPNVFQSFYNVIPAHGRLDLSSDVARYYCKLLESYNRSFRHLAQFLEANYLDLFEMILPAIQPPGQRYLSLVDSFRNLVRESSSGNREIQTSFELEDTIASLAMKTPTVMPSEVQVSPESALCLSGMAFLGWPFCLLSPSSPELTNLEKNPAHTWSPKNASNA